MTPATSERMVQVGREYREGDPALVIFAKNQPEYMPLPALTFTDGKILTEWELTEAERLALANGAPLRLWIWRFDQPLQPVMLQVAGVES
jgi:hypothetical protein